MMGVAGSSCGLPGRAAFLAVALLALSGCSSFIDLKPSGPPPARYLLSPPVPRANAERAQAALVLVTEPAMPRALATDGMAVQEGRWRFSYLAGARWGDRAPVMMARLLRRTLDAMPEVVALGGDETGISAHWRLTSEVDAFQIEVPSSGAPLERVRVAIDVRLFRLHPAGLVAERRFERTQTITGPADAAGAVAAFQRVFDMIEHDLQQWLRVSLATPEGSDAAAD